MRIGVPREIKPLESRVALIPEACRDLVRLGHSVLVQSTAGEGSGFPDSLYLQAGVTLLEDAASLYAEAELIVKVKEPWGPELDLLRQEHLLFSFLHLPANPELQERLLRIGLTAVGFETLEEAGRLPILAPMSDIAGRLAIQYGTTLLYRPNGGKGLLLGGLPAAERGRVVVLGAGNAGSAAVRMAAATGAGVTVFDRKPEKLEAMRRLGPNVTGLYPWGDSLSEAVAEADLLVGAVLVPGARAPRLISTAQVASMAPGSVLVDISVDQGGCVETTRPTTYEHPTYVVHDIVHFTVTNMPGVVPRSASRALCTSLYPWLVRLSKSGWRSDPALSAAVNLDRGFVVYPSLRGG
jgi:alanine dehydrogenase